MTTLRSASKLILGMIFGPSLLLAAFWYGNDNPLFVTVLALVSGFASLTAAFAPYFLKEHPSRWRIIVVSCGLGALAAVIHLVIDTKSIGDADPLASLLRALQVLAFAIVARSEPRSE